MKLRITSILLFVGIFSYAQKSFEKGFFILNNGTRIDCFIKNKNWRDNPDQFEYKRTLNGKTEIGRIGLVKEFTIINSAKFIKTSIEISQPNNNSLSSSKKTKLAKESVFLKTLVESDMSLYSLKKGKLVKFYYGSKSNYPKPLVYKEYESNSGKVIANQTYLAQLHRFMTCEGLNINNISYTKKELKQYFIAYNKCKGALSVIDYSSKDKKEKFSASLVGGIGLSSANIDDRSYGAFVNLNGDIGSQAVFKFGAVIEFILPYNDYEWSFFAMPTYQSFNQTNSLTHGSLVITTETYEVDYTSIEIPVGVRKYFTLESDAKVYLDAAYLVDIPLNSYIRTSDTRRSEDEITSGPAISLGIGYKSNINYGIELRYSTNRNILSNEIFKDSNYSNLSLLITYKLF